MSRRYLFFAVAIVVFVAVVWLMDPFLLFILGVAPLLWIGLPVSLFSISRLFYASASGAPRRHWQICLCGVAAFACFVGLAIPANHFIQERAIATAKEYPAQVAPLLEAYREAHGSYPTSLDQIPTKPPVPRLLRKPYGYGSDRGSYFFNFAKPGGLIDSWHYDSRARTWRLST